MARKQSAYTRYRRSIQAYIRRQRKMGVELPTIEVPKTEKELRKQGITGSKLSAEARKLKRLRETLPTSEALMVETGELGTAQEFAKQRRREKRKRQEAITLNAFDWVYERISEITDVSRAFYVRGTGVIFMDFSSRKNALIGILNDAISEAEDLAELERYYYSIESQLSDEIQVINYDSDQSRVEYSFSTLAVLLKGRTLTTEESRGLSELTDNYYDEY